MLQNGPDGAFDGSWVDNWELKRHKIPPTYKCPSVQGHSNSRASHVSSAASGPNLLQKDSSHQRHQFTRLTKHSDIGLLRWKMQGSLLAQQKPGAGWAPKTSGDYLIISAALAQLVFGRHKLLLFPWWASGKIKWLKNEKSGGRRRPLMWSNTT